MTKKNEESGFTLIEILIVLALLGVMMAIVVPTLGGFLGRGQPQAWAGDRDTIQVAVDSYYTDSTRRPGRRLFPTGDGSSSDTPTTTVYINIDHLLSENYLRNAPKSSSSVGNPGGGTGSYNWFVDSRGVVTSVTSAGVRGFATGVYP